MVQKFKSKFEKHVQDNEKRKESLKRKLNEKLSCKEVIKNALSNSSIGKSKKIVFDDIDSENESNEGNVNENNLSSLKKTEEDKLYLFDESDNDDVNYEIQIKNKFEGKKGHELLNLQSKYNNDERFKLDERFYDDEGCDSDSGSHQGNDIEKCENSKSNELEGEKLKQLKILEDVLGHPVEEKQKKSKKSFTEMVRFDASNEDHKRREVPNQNVKEVRVSKKKKLTKEERKKKKMEAVENESKVNLTSEEKFYTVSDDLKMALKSGKNQNCQFSLLDTFSRYDVDGEEPSISDSVSEKDGFVNPVEKEEAQVQKFEEEKVEVAKAQGITRERFFFVKDDPRIEEGLNFINMRNSEEAKKALENYDTARRDIREVLRLRWQKHRQRNNPFKKKVGGSFKKSGKFNGKRKIFGKNERNR